jgi:SWIM zinc finger
LSERSVASPARRSTSPPLDKERLADAVEEALARLREARPHLESRLDRAATYLVVHMSSSTRTRPIKVRVRKNGRPVFLVTSLTSGGAVYEVNPADWSCSCPDFHRRGSACKHALAAWILASAATDPTTKRPAEAQEPIQGDEGEEATVPKRAPSDGLTHAQARCWLESQRWHFAKTMPDNPHEYCPRREAADEGMFEAMVTHIREFGQPYPWWGTVYLQYVAGDFAYWTMGKRPQETILVNRKTLERVRLDQLTNKGGGGIVWPWLHQDVEAEREDLRRQESGQDEFSGGGT